MMPSKQPSSRLLLALCGFIGLIPAVMLMLVFRAEGGELIALGQSLGPYNLPRWLATLLSTLRPMILLLPIALLYTPKTRGWSYWSAAPLGLGCLLLPSMLAALIKGLEEFGHGFWVLLLVIILVINFQLWLTLLSRLTGKAAAVLIFALAWAINDWFFYLDRYVLAYQSITWLKMVTALGNLLPQVAGGPLILDELLTFAEADWRGLLPTFLQIPVLATLVWWFTRRSEPKPSE